MATAVIDGITTRYEVLGAGPPLLMYSPGGFNATIETWSTQGAYAKIKPLEHLTKKYTCIVFDRRECGLSGGRVERVTWAHYVAQGRGLLAHLGISQAHLMGGCMGCPPPGCAGDWAPHGMPGTSSGGWIGGRPPGSPKPAPHCCAAGSAGVCGSSAAGG